MRLLFATYSLAFQNPGGGERVLLALRRELERQGHSVDLFDPWRHRVESYDLIHYFSCLETSFWHHAKARAPRVPLVVTPTLYQPEGRWHRIATRARVEALGLAGRNRWRHLRLPDAWAPTTEAEADGLRQCWGIGRDRMRVIPNGVEARFGTATPEAFRARFGITGPFALHVGRFHPVKNQKALIEAARQAQVACVFLGDPDGDHREYHRQCRELAAAAEAADPTGATRYHFIPAVAHEDPLLASAYAAAEVFVLPSRFETFGLAALEAGVAGCPLLLTRGMRSREIFAGIAELFDPSDVDGLARALKRNRTAPSAEKRAALAREYSWERIAGELVALYQELGGRMRAGLPTATP